MDHILRKSAPPGVLPVAQELGQGGSERQLAVTAMGLRGGRFQPHVGTFRPGGFRLRRDDSHSPRVDSSLVAIATGGWYAARTRTVRRGQRGLMVEWVPVQN